MDEDQQEDLQQEQEKVVDIKTKRKLGIGAKVVITVVILGAIAAGVYAAIALA